MWWRVSSGQLPMTNDCARRRTSTASSATRRWPRTTRSSAHSLLPMPLSPMMSTPRPRMSIRTPWMMPRGGEIGRRGRADIRAIASGVAARVRSSGTRGAVGLDRQLRRRREAVGDEEARQVVAEDAPQDGGARGRRRALRGSGPRSRRTRGRGRRAGRRRTRRAPGPVFCVCGLVMRRSRPSAPASSSTSSARESARSRSTVATVTPGGGLDSVNAASPAA